MTTRNRKSKCLHLHAYWEKFDSYYCLVCDKWLEDKCKDKGCEFCVDRPTKPSMAVLEQYE